MLRVKYLLLLIHCLPTFLLQSGPSGAPTRASSVTLNEAQVEKIITQLRETDTCAVDEFDKPKALPIAMRLSSDSDFSGISQDDISVFVVTISQMHNSHQSQSIKFTDGCGFDKYTPPVSTRGGISYEPGTLGCIIEDMYRSSGGDTRSTREDAETGVLSQDFSQTVARVQNGQFQPGFTGSGQMPGFKDSRQMFGFQSQGIHQPDMNQFPPGFSGSFSDSGSRDALFQSMMDQAGGQLSNAADLIQYGQQFSQHMGGIQPNVPTPSGGDSPFFREVSVGPRPDSYMGTISKSFAQCLQKTTGADKKKLPAETSVSVKKDIDDLLKSISRPSMKKEEFASFMSTVNEKMANKFGSKIESDHSAGLYLMCRVSAIFNGGSTSGGATPKPGDDTSAVTVTPKPGDETDDRRGSAAAKGDESKYSTAQITLIVVGAVAGTAILMFIGMYIYGRTTKNEKVLNLYKKIGMPS